MKKRFLSMLLIMAVIASIPVSVTPIALASSATVTINRSEIILNVGATTQLSATANPADSGNRFFWESSVPAVATITQDGIVHARAAGVTQVSVVLTRPNGEVIRSANTSVEVRQPTVAVSHVTLDSSSITMTMSENPILTATVHPSDATNQSLTWTSSNINVAYLTTVPNLNDAQSNFQRMVVPVAPGTTTITVRTHDGRTASSVVTVASFIPVSAVHPGTTQMGMGTTVNLNHNTVVLPHNAAWHNLPDALKVISWRIIEDSSTVSASLSGANLTVPWGRTGRVVVEATVFRGLAASAAPWNHAEDRAFTTRITINVVGFIGVTEIIDVPSRMVVGRPLTLRGTISPAAASGRNISWSLTPGEPNDTQAFLSADNTILTAQYPGTVHIRATIPNGEVVFTDVGQTIRDFVQDFVIWVGPYNTNILTLRAEPGGVVTGAGAGRFAPDEVIRISAVPSRDFIFAGWYSSNGGKLSDPNSATTDFTMPPNDTTVTAFFTFVGFGDTTSATPSAPVTSRQEQAAERIRAQSARARQAQVSAARTFNDVNESDWFSAGAGFVTDRGWMVPAAESPNLFMPNDVVTLGDVALALHRKAGNPSVIGAGGVALQGQTAAVEWVRSIGLLTTSTPNPSANVTRQEVCVMLGRLVGHMRWSYTFIRPDANFTDLSAVDPGVRIHINNLFRAGVISGRTGVTFAPQETMTRAEFATMLHRFVDAMGL